jgi:CheY-like chemotaxis protein
MLVPPARTVAVIDDDRRVLASLANLLASEGYETRACESALNFFADGDAGLVCVITDLGMRPIDGMQVLERVVHSDVATPVIIITGKPSEQTQGYLSAKRRIGFLQKAYRRGRVAGPPRPYRLKAIGKTDPFSVSAHILHTKCRVCCCCCPLILLAASIKARAD